MPLKLDFKSGDKLVINGAVLENIGPNAKLLVHNESAILREKEVLSVQETATPASRTYFALQCAYMFAHKREEYLGLFNQYLDEYIEACPSATELAEEIRDQVSSGKLYRGLKQTQKLILHEGNVLAMLEEGLQEFVEDLDSDDEDGVSTIEDIDANSVDDVGIDPTPRDGAEGRQSSG